MLLCVASFALCIIKWETEWVPCKSQEHFNVTLSILLSGESSLIVFVRSVIYLAIDALLIWSTVLDCYIRVPRSVYVACLASFLLDTVEFLHELININSYINFEYGNFYGCFSWTAFNTRLKVRRAILNGICWHHTPKSILCHVNYNLYVPQLHA